MKSTIIMFITLAFLFLNVKKQVKAEEPKYIYTGVNEQDEEIGSSKSGVASFYHNRFVGRRTANGEIFSNTKYTCASNKYKLGTYLKVTNLENGRVVYVKVNDRMASNGRLIDLSRRCAKDLNFINSGLTKVTVQEVNSIHGERKVLAQYNGNQDSDNLL